ncbi:MAG: YciI family protein [bacterium]
MRFLLLIKANNENEQATVPGAGARTEMGKFNEELVRAGVLLAADGLQPSSKGARVTLSDDTRTVTDGPFAETKELVAGFCMIQVKSKEEAVEWAKRCPNPRGAGFAEIEVRQVSDAADPVPSH